MSDDLRNADEAYYEALGRAIKVLRTARGIERKELAALADISYPYLSQIEAGAKRASSDVIRAIADALGLRPHELLENADQVMTSSPSMPRRARAMSAPTEASRADQNSEIVHDMAAPMMAAMAAPPPAFAPQSEPARKAARWFHAEAPAPALPPPPPPAGRSRRELLGELVALTETLGDDDLERLVDLAQRLTHITR